MRYFEDLRKRRELSRKRAVADYFEMASERPLYTREEWDRKSAALLKTAVARKLGVFKTREGKALEEFLRLSRNEMLKTPQMQRKNLLNSLASHPLMFGVKPEILNGFAELNSGIRRFDQIQYEGNGFKVIWHEGGKLASEHYEENSEAGRELKKLFENAERTGIGREYEDVLTAKHLGLADQLTLKEHIARKYKLKWDKKLEDKLAQMTKLHPAFATR